MMLPVILISYLGLVHVQPNILVYKTKKYFYIAASVVSRSSINLLNIYLPSYKHMFMLLYSEFHREPLLILSTPLR